MTARVSGSSPLARGTRRLLACCIARHRLIPARAGNTRTPATTSPGITAHPRSRGEHATELARLNGKRGSSPLARGTLSRRLRALLTLWLIPARAGNTFMRRHTLVPPAAHPRSRGEHVFGARTWCARRGSSPLARGTHTHSLRGNRECRLIPARAGNTPHQPHRF